MSESGHSASRPGRRSVRLSTTVPAALMAALEQRALEEGLSLSNLVAYLLESSLDHTMPP